MAGAASGWHKVGAGPHKGQQLFIPAGVAAQFGTTPAGLAARIAGGDGAALQAVVQAPPLRGLAQRAAPAAGTGPAAPVPLAAGAVSTPPPAPLPAAGSGPTAPVPVAAGAVSTPPPAAGTGPTAPVPVAVDAVSTPSPAPLPVGAVSTPPPAAGTGQPLTAPPDPATLTVVAALGGSTGATLVVDPHGQRWVRKAGASPAHRANEVVADAAYRALGVPVPASWRVDVGGAPAKLARYLVGQPLGHHPAPAVRAQLQQHFVADALLANWDVIGPAADNILVTPDGTPWRIDTGGALGFRAQGLPKPPGAWDAYPRALWSMRSSVNPAAQVVFGSLTLPDLCVQIAALLPQAPALLAVLPPADRAIVAQRLAWLTWVRDVGQALRAQGQPPASIDAWLAQRLEQAAAQQEPPPAVAAAIAQFLSTGGN